MCAAFGRAAGTADDGPGRRLNAVAQFVHYVRDKAGHDYHPTGADAKGIMDAAKRGITPRDLAEVYHVIATKQWGDELDRKHLSALWCIRKLNAYKSWKQREYVREKPAREEPAAVAAAELAELPF